MEESCVNSLIEAMSQSNNEPERIEPTPPDGIEKTVKSKEVKEENVKKEIEARKKLADISAPKKRKILHKLMLKYHKDPFYEQIDIAKEILRKLRVSSTSYFIRRIRQDMYKWMEVNVYDHDIDLDDTDSKKKILKDTQKSKENVLAANGEEVKEKVALDKAEPLKPENDEAKTSEIKFPPLPKALCNCGHQVINSKKVGDKPSDCSTSVESEKEVPLIDLTVDLKTEIKMEVVTIDEDSSNIRSADNEQVKAAGGLPGMQYPVFGYDPTMSFYYPEGFYHPYYSNYDPNMQMYSPYMMPYGFQYPYHPHFYNPSYNSDLLPNYPIDPDNRQNPKLVSDTTNLQSSDNNNVSAPKDANVPLDANMK